MCWPLTNIPVLIVVGVPIVLGGAVYLGIRRLLGGD